MSLCVVGVLGLDRRLEEMRGDIDQDLARAVVADWSTAPLDPTEQAILAFTAKESSAQATMRSSDVEALRAVHLDDRTILALATLVAYQNYALRAAQAFGVSAR